MATHIGPDHIVIPNSSYGVLTSKNELLKLT